MPEISVIFPIYQVEAYIRRSIVSLCEQTYKDFEIILVNDGTKDNSMVIAEDILVKRYPSQKYRIINQKNSGLSAARNAGLQVAAGKYVAFMDSDDVVQNNYLGVLYNDAVAKGADLVIGNYRTVDIQHCDIFTLQSHKGLEISKIKLYRLCLRRKIPFYCGVFLMMRSLLDANGISFNPEIKYSVDQAFMWKVIYFSKKVVYNKTIVYNYLRRPNSIMTSTKYDIIFPSIDLFAKELSELDDHQLGFSKELIYGRWLVGILHSSAKLLDYNDFQKLRNEIGRKCRLWKLIGKIDLKYDFIVLLSIMYNKGAYYLLRKI